MPRLLLIALLALPSRAHATDGGEVVLWHAYRAGEADARGATHSGNARVNDNLGFGFVIGVFI